MPGVSIHIVDVTRGLPAQGMQVTLWRLAPAGRVKVGEGSIGSDGTMSHPMTTGAGVEAGEHEVEMAAGPYFRSTGAHADEPGFLETAAFRFHVTDPADHYHLPIKLSPWGLSIWRGR